MAYQQNITPPRTQYGHPPPQNYAPSGPQYDNAYGQQPQNQNSKTQQRRLDGYYHSGFWRDYGAQPLDTGSHGPMPGQSPHGGQQHNDGFAPNSAGGYPQNVDQIRPQAQMQGPPRSQSAGIPAQSARGPPPSQFTNDYSSQRRDAASNGMLGRSTQDQYNGPSPMQTRADESRSGYSGGLRVANHVDDNFRAPPPPSRGNTMPINGSASPSQAARHRPPPLGNASSAPAQRKPLIDPTSPTKLAWDNPFPVFPTKPMRSQTTPAESMNDSRPPTAASKTSGRSTASRQSERSNHSTEATSYENSIRDPLRDLSIGNGPYDDRPIGPSRSATMPVQNFFPPNERRPSATSQHSGRNGMPPIGNQFDANIRSASSASFRNNEPRHEFGPISRAQTFNAPQNPYGNNTQSARESLDDYMPNFDNPGPSHTTGEEYMPNFDGPNTSQVGEEYMPNFDGPDVSRSGEEYMPNFDGLGSTQSLADSLGLPIDGAPGLARPPTSNSHPHPARSQPNLRDQYSDIAMGGPQFDPPMPQDANNFREDSRAGTPHQFQPRGSSRAALDNSSGGLEYAERGRPNPYQNGPQRVDTRQNSWGDRRGDNPRSAPPGGPPGGGFRGPAQNRGSDNPDALPNHPVPVRPGHMQQQNARNAPQMQRRPQSNQREPEVPSRPSSPPVTHEELNQLREKLRSAPSDYRSHLRLAKRLVKASDTLIDTQGDLDLKTRNRNREKFVLEAHKVIKKLVQHSYPEAMFYLAECYGAGNLGLQTDHKEAFSLYQGAAKLGHAGAAYRTAVCCEIGGEGSRKDPQKAVQWYRRAAALGDVGAMYKLGVIIVRGLLNQQASPGEGIIWLNRAAERADEDNPHAVHELALLHEFPLRASAMTQDLKYSLQLYQQAAKLGYRLSQARLGKAFEYGQLGCPLDDRASIHWYSKAAAQEEPEAELALAGWYLTGSRGVLEPNEQESYLWARKAALREQPKAEFAMGYFSELGIGCQVNLDDARRWYGRSASHNYPKAKGALENLRRPNQARQKRQRYSRSGPNEECTVM